MDEDGVRSRLESVRIRLAELLALNGGDLAGVEGHVRQQLSV